MSSQETSVKAPLDSFDKMQTEINASFEKASEEEGMEFDPREHVIAAKLAEILCGTELPRFSIVNITSTANTVVNKKFDLLDKVSGLKGRIIPGWLVRDYPIAFDGDTLRKAPWVNMVHAWMKALNYMNTISAMQHGETATSAEIIVAITHELWKSTTDANDEVLLRGGRHLENEEKDPETLMREQGTMGVNAKRHVCYEEMRYILEAIKESFARSEDVEEV